MNFTCCQAVLAVYIYSQGEVQIITPIFIDDIMLMGTSPAANDKVVEEINHHFKLCNLSPTKFLLGIHIMHDFTNQTISLSQHQYIINILEHFGMSD